LETSWQVHLEAGFDGSPWSILSRRLGGTVRLLALFGLLHAVLVVAGLQYREETQGLIILWPATGLLFLALWLSGRRHWPWIIAIQLATELAARASFPGIPVGEAVESSLLHLVEGLVGGVAIQQMLRGWQGLRITPLLSFMAAGALSAGCSALLRTVIGYAIHDGSGGGQRALHEFLADLLGMLVMVPPLLAWMVAWRFRQLFALTSVLQRVEVAAVLILQVALSIMIFAPSNLVGADQLKFPVFVVPGLIYGAFRLPPRWSATVMAVTILIVLWLIAHGGNPLGIEQTLSRFIWIQAGATTFLLATISLLVFVAQSRVAMASLAAGESRYRSFIEMSHEAVWRIEVRPPMPVDLPHPAQLQWLREHARVVESSESFGRLGAAASVGSSGRWATDVPWIRIFEADLGKISSQGYQVQDLRFTVPGERGKRTFLTSFTGVVQDGRLERIWGVARDVTELLELNARLLREQELLRSYARRIVSAEDNTRHNTAADLHNGIGQELIAMGMMLTVLGKEFTPEQRAQADELRSHLHTVQQRTRDLISDLSPPGLYDLGLMPALQWLVVYLRGHDKLQVELDGKIDEMAVPTETRVLVFKLVRELLRNVSKHAGVDKAAVTLHGDRTQLTVHVTDAGKGFAWNPDTLVSPPRGFGLWSVAHRVAEAGGTLTVSTAPGSGAKVSIRIPLNRNQGTAAGVP
jgi:signal transduction histidine kinase